MSAVWSLFHNVAPLQFTLNVERSVMYAYELSIWNEIYQPKKSSNITRGIIYHFTYFFWVFILKCMQ